MTGKIVVYPGTFDPITLGHLDVIEAVSDIFDMVAVGILTNPNKKPMFSEQERLAMIEETIEEYDFPNVDVVVFRGLTIDFAKQEQAVAIVRGLRLVMDFEAELDISFNNRVLDGDMHTIFIPPRQEHIHIRSSTVRELLAFNVEENKLLRYVPNSVIAHIRKSKG